MTMPGLEFPWLPSYPDMAIPVSHYFAALLLLALTSCPRPASQLVVKNLVSPDVEHGLMYELNAINPYAGEISLWVTNLTAEPITFVHTEYGGFDSNGNHYQAIDMLRFCVKERPFCFLG
jgi:hypothetical protein